MNPSQKTLRPKPPDKGSFPLDHEGTAKHDPWLKAVIELVFFVYFVQESVNSLCSNTLSV